jgi:lactoylglutathione lyase
MSLIKKLSFPEAKFDLYFLAYDGASAKSHGDSTFDREGVIELTHNYGTESDDSYVVNNGNKEPHRGFGHVCISVDYIQAACQRIEDAGYRFQKKLADGRMKNIAFALDPDGYWVEIVSQRIGSKGADDPEEQGAATDPGTYRMVRSSSNFSLCAFLRLSLPFCCVRDWPGAEHNRWFVE